MMAETVHGEALHPVCPVCGTAAGNYCLSVNDYRVFKCPGCGLEHTYPIPTRQQLQDFYAQYRDIRAATDVTTRNAHRNLQALECFGYTPEKNILDFGTGEADFVAVAGDNCYGIDFKASLKARVFQDFEQLPVRSFDFVTLWAVLEHLDRPVAILEQLKRLLKPGGKMVLTTVDTEGLIPYYHKPVEHLTYWTKSAFVHLFEQLDMRVIVHRPYRMEQRSEVYLDRLLSRTPEQYRTAFTSALSMLPEYVEIPTNEVFVVAEA